MPPSTQPESSHRRHQQPVDKLSKCIQYIKSPDGGGFKTFGDFMTGLFTEHPTNPLSTTDSAYQTVTQTVRTFLKWGPLKGFLDKVSSHTQMVRDGGTEGVVPPYCIGPGVATPESMFLLQHKEHYLICYGGDNPDKHLPDPAGQGILLCWALPLILEEIDKEADALIYGGGSSFRCPEKWTWESLSELSLDSQQTFAAEKAPILWSILATIAVNKKGELQWS